jgi:hypothetical protein
MKRPIESDYTSLASYTRALEHYCDTAQPTGQAPCVRHCEANAFKIMIRNLKGDIERMKAAQPKQEPVACKHEWFHTSEMQSGECRCIKCGAWKTVPSAALKENT